MADFESAFKKMIDNEGGYQLTEVEGDRGGMTYAGISRKHHPNWVGWHYIDKSGPVFTVTLEKMVTDFYREKFWNRIQGGEIKDQGIAESVFDFAVNAGVSNSVRCLQKSLRNSLAQDGIMGPKTMGILNRFGGLMPIEERMVIEKVRYYKDIAGRNESQLKFLVGWINRALRGVE